MRERFKEIIFPFFLSVRGWMHLLVFSFSMVFAHETSYANGIDVFFFFVIVIVFVVFDVIN